MSYNKISTKESFIASAEVVFYTMAMQLDDTKKVLLTSAIETMVAYHQTYSMYNGVMFQSPEWITIVHILRDAAECGVIFDPNYTECLSNFVGLECFSSTVENVRMRQKIDKITWLMATSIVANKRTRFE
jgi:hypothetical protein